MFPEPEPAVCHCLQPDRITLFAWIWTSGNDCPKAQNGIAGGICAVATSVSTAAAGRAFCAETEPGAPQCSRFPLPFQDASKSFRDPEPL